jgi:lysozyme
MANSARATVETLTQSTTATKRQARNANHSNVDSLTGVAKDHALVATEDSADPITAIRRSVASSVPYPGKPLQYVAGKSVTYSAAAKQWQSRMQQRGWAIQVDGYYGPDSANICRQFQRAKGITVNGIVGPTTWAASFRNDVVIPGTGGNATGHINQQGLNLVKRYEGLVLQAYQDPVGILTIGYGHTGSDVYAGEVISAAQAEALLKRDLTSFENSVRQLVKVPLTSNQFSALVSFTYNVGVGALSQSTLLALLNQRDYQGAANQFSRWVYAGGSTLPGLVSRRNAEQALFLA